ncbi:MAG: hypothetical protein IPJ37_06930 [Bacteroidales bacterium]|nr:hypothetical protein [Bacteroidales bacterium]
MTIRLAKYGQALRLMQYIKSTTLKRSVKSQDEIGETMGHSTPKVTEHCLASLDMDKTWEINKGLL